MSFVDYSKIGILTTVSNDLNFKKSSSLFPVGIQLKFIVMSTNGMHGLNVVFCL
jgi:hypothetical protein